MEKMLNGKAGGKDVEWKAAAGASQVPRAKQQLHQYEDALHVRLRSRCLAGVSRLCHVLSSAGQRDGCILQAAPALHRAAAPPPHVLRAASALCTRGPPGL